MPILLLLLLALVPAASAQQQRPATHVIFVTLDGLRWQEVFDGASPLYLGKEASGGRTVDSAGLAARFWRPGREDRRRALMPFLWSTIHDSGQIIGNPALGASAQVTNGLWFSYPGYNEMLAGAADPRITSNDSIPNPNLTVLEWLNRQPGFVGRVAAFGSWEILEAIVNTGRSGVHTNGAGPPVTVPGGTADSAFNQLAMLLPPLWGTTRLDGPTMVGALQYLRSHRPRVLYVMLGETDEWAHDQRYDLYLDAAWRGDLFLRMLWVTVQAIPEYAGRTALVVSTDHGRGSTPSDWGNHGREYPEAGRIWMAAIGPGIPAAGERSRLEVTQSQLAATLAALLGLDFRTARPEAAPPLPF